MNKHLALCLAMLAVLVTGCPNNEYLVELTPHEKVMERKLTFYCQDGTDTNGAPKYQSFPADELRAIRRFYPKGGVQLEGRKHIATGEFAGAMPGDVGGAGTYTILSSSLGSAAFYVERFRGNDDMAGRIEIHLKSADKLVDYIIGWSQKEFGGERHYQDLRRFLNGDFRQDMKNLSLHGWMMQTSTTTGAPAPEEFAVRFGQYLAERGYFKIEDVPRITRGFTGDDPEPLMRLIQQLVAQKLKVPKSKPLPQALAFLADADKFGKSWDDYLATTTEYRTLLRHWQMQKVTAETEIIGQKIARHLHPRSSTNAPLPTVPNKPEPSEVVNELFNQLWGDEFGETADHLTVRLRLPAAPVHTNGKWDDARKQVFWEASLTGRTNSTRLPALCYASWEGVNEDFQKAHFGKVLLKDDELLEYCLWRGGLTEKRAAEWDALVAGLQPGDGLLQKLSVFRFSDEPPPAAKNPKQPQTANPSGFPVQLIQSALEQK